MGTISPYCSATGMKSSGGTDTPSRDQRSSASTAVTRPVARSTTGW